MNGQLYITTRMMFSLARAGYAPRRWGELNARGIPLGALLASTSGIAVAAVLNAVSPGTAFTLMMSVSMFGAIFAWLMIFITHFFFRRHHARDAHYDHAPLAFRMWGYPWSTAAGVVLMVAILVTTAFTREFRMTLVCGVPFLLLLTVIFQVRRRKAPIARRAAAGVSR